MATKSQRDAMRVGLKEMNANLQKANDGLCEKIAELEQRNRNLEAELLLEENQVGRLEGAFLKMRDFINNELVVMRAPPQAPVPAPTVEAKKEGDDGD